MIKKNNLYSKFENNGEIESLFKLAKQGDAEAQFKLAISYAHGKGVELNYLEAMKWLGKAARQGDVKAQSYLGFCYRHGIGIKKN